MLCEGVELISNSHKKTRILVFEEIAASETDHEEETNGVNLLSQLQSTFLPSTIKGKFVIRIKL